MFRNDISKGLSHDENLDILGDGCWGISSETLRGEREREREGEERIDDTRQSKYGTLNALASHFRSGDFSARNCSPF
jgi:hypothetical protein